MSDIVAAKRYADALFQLGSEKSILDQFENDFTIVREVFANNEELNTFLVHPRVTGEQKKELLAVSLKGLHTDVINTVKLLVDRHRTMLIPTIVDEFIKKVNDAKGIEVATVYSVRELTSNEKENLKRSFSKKLGKSTVEFKGEIEPSLIGGIKIRVGNTIYDGSISGRLKRIEQRIIAANI